MNRALSPNGLDLRMWPDTNAEIDAELNAAKAKYGSNDFELLCLEGSRGDTLDDEPGRAARVVLGRADFEQRFTLDHSADGMVDLYREVVERGR